MNQRRTIIGVVLATLVLGVVGAAAAGEVILLRMAEPRTESGRAWRLFGLATLTTGLVAGLAVGAYVAASDVGSGSSASIVLFAFLEGGVIAGFVGVVLGSLVGAVLAVDLRRRPARP
jgi:hypothetical protein